MSAANCREQAIPDDEDTRASQGLLMDRFSVGLFTVIPPTALVNTLYEHTQ
jgi:hypothetical protein